MHDIERATVAIAGRRLAARAIGAVVAGVLVGGALAPGASGSPRDGVGDWTTFHGTSDRAGVATSETILGEGNAATLTESWSYTTGGQVQSSPAVVGGVVYVGSADKKVYALNATTGTKIWSYKTGGEIYSSPTVTGGVVYIGADDNKLYAIDAAAGTLKWSYATGGKIAGSSPLVANGMVYVGSRDGYLYALNQTTGAFVWKYNTWAIWGAPAFSGTTVYAGSDKSTVFAFNATTGALLWSATTGGRVRSGVAVSGGTVYVGADDDRVYAFNASTGALVWKTSPFPNSGIVRSTPAVSGGSVYVDTGETTPMGSHLYVLSTATGAQLCNHEMADYATSSVAIANGLAIVGSYSFQLYVFDASTCDKLWDSGFTIMQGGIASSPAVSNGAIYVGSNDDGVYAFAPGGGVPVGTLVAITDAAFTPKDAIGHDIGKSVQWTNDGSLNHTVTDSTGMGLFDSGTISPGGTFTFPFFAACIYKYKDSLHAALTGTVKAPVVVSPTTGGTTTTFTIQWATAPPAAGYVYDVQIQRPGNSAWSNWVMGTTTTLKTFVPDAGRGTYSFKAHVKQSSSGTSCTYSSAVSIVVS